MMYYCFVCHEGGDVFNFLTKRRAVVWTAQAPAPWATSSASRTKACAACFT